MQIGTASETDADIGVDESPVESALREFQKNGKVSKRTVDKFATREARDQFLQETGYDIWGVPKADRMRFVQSVMRELDANKQNTQGAPVHSEVKAGDVLDNGDLDEDFGADAGAKNPTGDGGRKYSLNIEHIDGTVEVLADLRNLTDEQSIHYLESARAFELLDETYIPIRKELPQVIIDSLLQEDVHLENRSLVMEVGKARRLMRQDNNRANGKRGHGLTPRQIVDIINDIDNPIKIFYQTNRVDQNGRPLPNNVAIFVKYSKNGINGFATVEFENPERTEVIGQEFGETNFYTVNTAFFTDTTKNGKPFNYMERLEANPDNIELEIKRRQSEDSANWKKHPSTTNELPFNNSIRNPGAVVNSKNSLSQQGRSDDLAPLPWQIRGEDVTLEAPMEDIGPVAENVETEGSCRCLHRRDTGSGGGGR